MMRVLVLFARHGVGKYVQAFEQMRSELRQRLAGCELDFVIIDAALGADFAPVHENGALLLGTDNEHWEFGSWMRAARSLGRNVLKYDYVHIVTSAFYFGYVDFKDYLSTELLRNLSGRAVALGHLEAYNEPARFRGVRFQSWLRSSFILMPATELLLLGDLVSVHDRRGIFANTPQSPFLKDGDLCETYQHNLFSWLTGEGTGQGVIWHSRFELDSSNFEFFKNKAVAIINEMMLSNRLRQQGCALVDLTWLHRHHPDGRVPGRIPTWHAQVTNRGTGHESLKEGVC